MLKINKLGFVKSIMGKFDGYILVRNTNEIFRREFLEIRNLSAQEFVIKEGIQENNLLVLGISQIPIFFNLNIHPFSVFYKRKKNDVRHV